MEHRVAAVRPRVFGILNVTPDSFSDGGRYLDPGDAIDHAEALVAAGADVIDVGGESTRPGAHAVHPVEEQLRVLPVVQALAQSGIAVSIDTRSASTAARAVEVGASWINDVSGGTFDPAMPGVMADSGVEVVLMHSVGPAGETRVFHDVVAEVRDELARRVDRVVAVGVDAARIVLDPGLGFSKGAADNWRLLAALDRIGGDRVLIGASRKRFLVPLASGDTATADPRDLPTALVSAFAAHRGAWGLRVHDVASTRVALAVEAAWAAGAAS